MANKKNVEIVKSIELGPSSRLKTAVWKMRVGVRDMLGGKDILNADNLHEKPARKSAHHIYKKADEFILNYFPNFTKQLSKKVATKRVRDMLDAFDYTVVEANETKPWGAYYRLSNDEAGRFVEEFFPGLSLTDAKLGHDDIELSPKFLLVSPDQRLSWQLHHRRAERWRFLTQGAYYKSTTDDQGSRTVAEPDFVVQFAQGERHRLCAFDNQNYTLVAEIWQHVDPNEPSNEDDIIRLSDDYNR